jgi:hypothetical protein
MLRTSRGWIFSGIATLGMLWLIVGSETFQECIEHSKHDTEAKTFQEHISKLTILAATYEVCSGEFIHKNGEAITAIFTVVLAFSTIGLWIATKGLYEAGERQIALTKISAEASRDSASAALRQVRMSEALQRAQMDTDGFETVADMPNVAVIRLRIAIRWKNYGQTSAVDVGLELAWRFIVDGDELVFSSLPPRRGGSVGGGAGVKTDYAIIPVAKAVQVWRREIRAFLYSRAVYKDIFSETTDREAINCHEIKFAADPSFVMPASDRNTLMSIIDHNGPYRVVRRKQE